MDNYINLVKSISTNNAFHLLEIANNDKYTFESFTLKANEINKRLWLEENILESLEYGPLLNNLALIKDFPVLYIAEITDAVPHMDIVAAIHDFINKKTDRAFPAFSDKRINNEHSKVLYVGKVKRDFYGRIIQHMGYHRSAHTQGLQLSHWIPAIQLDVTFKYVVLKPEIGDFLSSIEYALANELKPILGKHK